MDATGAAYRGSQRQIQLYVNAHTSTLDAAVVECFPDDLSGAVIDWRSPLEKDGYAEYCDGTFLRAVGQGAHAVALKAFWPRRGPRWDALAVVRRAGEPPGVLLVEGKSRRGELLHGRGCAAEPSARALIETALEWTRVQLSVVGVPPDRWSGALYQSANRLAFLCWLRSRGISAWLVHVLFTGDETVSAMTREEWRDAVRAADRVLGLAGLAIPAASHVILPAKAP